MNDQQTRMWKQESKGQKLSHQEQKFRVDKMERDARKSNNYNEILFNNDSRSVFPLPLLLDTTKGDQRG